MMKAGWSRSRTHGNATWCLKSLRRVLRRAPEEIPKDWRRLVRGETLEERSQDDAAETERLIDALKHATPQDRAALASLMDDDTRPGIGDLVRLKEEIRRGNLAARNRRGRDRSAEAARAPWADARGRDQCKRRARDCRVRRHD